jgi:hypothetical protein
VFSLEREIYFKNTIKQSNISYIKEILPQAASDVSLEKITIFAYDRSKYNAPK